VATANSGAITSITRIASPSLGLPRPTISATVAVIWSKNVPNCPTCLPSGKFVHGSNGIVNG